MEKPHYVAFISYRHSDNREAGRCWATWLHRALETYAVPPDLIGTANLRGEPIPKRIYPVFRDEEEFAAEAALGPAICDALERSKTLIVLCSPRSVQSSYVAAEIRHFKSLGRSDHIVPALLDGEPGDPAREAFPEPLREKLAADGNASVEPLAADFRLEDASQGYTDASFYAQHLRTLPGLSSAERTHLVSAYREKSHLAFLKLVAAVLAVPLATLTRRDQVYQLTLARKRARVFRAVAAALSVLLAIAVLTGLYANRKRIEAVKARNSANDLVAFMLTDLHDQLSETGRLDVLSSAVEKVDAHLASNPVPPDLVADLRLQQARILFGQGRLEEAVSRVKHSLEELPADATSKAHRARLHAFLGDVLAWEQHQNEAARQECLTALGLFDPGDTDLAAVEALARTQVALGDILRDDQQVENALKAYEAAWTYAAGHSPQLDAIQVLALQHHAEVCHLNNKPADAANSVEKAITIAQKHLDQVSNSHPWLAALAETLVLRSAMERYSGRLTRSLESLRKAEECAEQTATPGQLHRQFLLAGIRSQIAAHPSPTLTQPQRAALFDGALHTQRALLREAPNNRDWAAKLASSLRDHASFQLGLGDLFQDESFQKQAVTDLVEAEALLRPVNLPGTLRERVETLLSLASIMPPEERKPGIMKAETLLAELPKDDVETLLLNAQLALLSAEGNESLLKAHNLILQAWEKAVGVRKTSLADHLAASYERLAALAASKKDLAGYREQSAKALDLRRHLLIPGADQPDQRESLALALNNHARSLRDLGSIDQSRATYQESAALFQNLTHEYPNHAPPLRELALAQYQLGKIAWGAQEGDKALALYKEAFATFQQFLQKAALEQPQPPVPMGAANLTTLAAIVGREVETAAALGRQDWVAAAWTRLVKVTDALPADRLSDTEAVEVANLRGHALHSAYHAFLKLETVPAGQAAELRTILVEMARSNPEVAGSEEFIALQKRLGSG